MTRLSAVPDAPARAVGLIRVSKEREEMISPELQRTAIEDHCARRGYRIVDWREGLDESGSRRRSKWWAKLDQAVEQVEARDADVIVVWRFDRTARNRLRWATAIDRVEVAGGLLESATEPLDVSTASGRFARGMLGEMAAYRAEEIGATWREVHARRTSRGLPANGKPRFGYRVVDGVHRPDPVEGPVLADLYRRYVAGESIYTLIGWLNQHGYRTVPGYSVRGPGPWTQTALRRMLDAGFGAGFITVAGERTQGVQEPVIDEATWTAYLAGRAARRTLRRSERSVYLLSGLMRCHYLLEDGSRCGSSMGGGQFGTQRQPKYRCIAAATERRHQGGYVTMQVVESAVMGWLQQLAGEIDDNADTAVIAASRAAQRGADAATLARETADADRALTRLAVNQSAEATAMPAAVFAAARDELLARRQALQDRALIAAREAQLPSPAAAAGALLDDWDELGVEQRKASLRLLVARVEVEPGRPKSVVHVVPTFTGDKRR